MALKRSTVNKSNEEEKDDSPDVDSQINKRYTVKGRLGKGAYGVVWKGIEKRTGTVVAVKKILDAFRNQTDAQRTFREVLFLQEFRGHPNIIKLLDVHRAKNNKDIYLVFEHMEIDLHNLIKKGQIFLPIHHQYIMYQMLNATRYLHSGNVIHRDYKPSNILLNKRCHCKVADFGLARSITSCNGLDTATTDAPLTDYVATRWYRAPELLLGSKKYTKGIDMWSLGCILFEMITGKTLFPGTSTINQIERIMNVIAKPTKEDVRAVSNSYAASILERAMKTETSSKALSVQLKDVQTDATDLISNLLLFQPHRRLTADEAFDHSFVTRFRRSCAELKKQKDVIPPLSDDVQLSIDQYRNKLYELVNERKSRHYLSVSAQSKDSNQEKTSERKPKTPNEIVMRKSASEIITNRKTADRNRTTLSADSICIAKDIPAKKSVYSVKRVVKPPISAQVMGIGDGNKYIARSSTAPAQSTAFHALQNRTNGAIRCESALEKPVSKHTDPDYSCAYVVVFTDGDAKGFGLAFTLGRGTELVVEAVKSLSHMIIGKEIRTLYKNFGNFWRELTSETQLRWVGPEKGVIHLAVAAIVNALWDLWARLENKPLWKLLVDMEPELLASTIDYRYISDVLTPEDVIEILRKMKKGREAREDELTKNGYPAYTTQVGWLGYSDIKVKELCRQFIKEGFNSFKIKVGQNLESDKHRCQMLREAIGPSRKLMVDANQRWSVPEAIAWMKELAPYNLLWIEEPTSPDDILGHATIAKALKPLGIKVATGEMCTNRVMFKQFLQAEALQFCQIDACRIGGVNEILSVYFMAKKFGVPVCPHAGGVGLCEMVQHLQMFDYVSITGSSENRMIEWIDHLHQHFQNPPIVKNGKYFPPQNIGYSTEIFEESLTAFEYPYGQEWQKLFKNGSYKDPRGTAAQLHKTK